MKPDPGANDSWTEHGWGLSGRTVTLILCVIVIASQVLRLF